MDCSGVFWVKEKAGPILFAVVSVLVLVYFWWLLIYDHGLTAH
jgi:hypothetical protein